MKTRNLLISTIVCAAMLLIITPNANAKKITKIACIGNSITYGAGVVGREYNSYPAQLGAMLGANEYTVENFGVSATTLLSHGNYPYISTQQWRDALNSGANIVFLKLGTNDSKIPNRALIATEFEKDLTAMITELRGMASKPRIVLLTPMRAFGEDTTNIYQGSIERDIVPRIRAVATAQKVECVDLQDVITKYDESLIPDAVHPTSIGAGMIATRLYQYLKHPKMMTTVAAPGNEFRSAAGWQQGTDWMSNHLEIKELMSHGGVDVLMVGNSITQGMGGERQVVTYKPGKEAMDSALPGLKWVSAGISGDRTQHVLWRLQNGEYEKGNPRYVFLTIGVNNIVGGGDSGENTAEGIIACAREITKRMPQAKVIVLGTLPAGAEPDHAWRLECAKEHEVLAAKLKGKNITYINPTPWFTAPDGKLIGELYGGDNLHLSQKGYEMWAGKIKELIK